MDTTRELRIVLDIDASSDWLTGRASTNDGVARSFTGRLGLLSVLDAILLDHAALPVEKDSHQWSTSATDPTESSNPHAGGHPVMFTTHRARGVPLTAMLARHPRPLRT